MPNTFLTVSKIAALAALDLRDAPSILNSMYRDETSNVTSTCGGTITIRKPNAAVARKLVKGGTTVKDAIVESSMNLKIDEHLYVAREITSEELLMGIESFDSQIVKPAINELVAKAEQYILKKVGLAAGAIDRSPKTWAELVSALKKLNKNKVPTGKRRGYISPEVEADLMLIDQFSNAASRGNSSTVDTGCIGTAMGVEWARTNNVWAETVETITDSTTDAGDLNFVCTIPAGVVIPAGTSVQFAGFAGRVWTTSGAVRVCY